MDTGLLKSSVPGEDVVYGKVEEGECTVVFE